MLVLSRKVGQKVRVGDDLLSVEETKRSAVTIKYKGKEYVLKPEQMVDLDEATKVMFKRLQGSYAKIGFISTRSIKREEICRNLTRRIQNSRGL